MNSNSPFTTFCSSNKISHCNHTEKVLESIWELALSFKFMPDRQYLKMTTKGMSSLLGNKIDAQTLKSNLVKWFLGFERDVQNVLLARILLNRKWYIGGQNLGGCILLNSKNRFIFCAEIAAALYVNIIFLSWYIPQIALQSTQNNLLVIPGPKSVQLPIIKRS